MPLEPDLNDRVNALWEYRKAVENKEPAALPKFLDAHC